MLTGVVQCQRRHALCSDGVRRSWRGSHSDGTILRPVSQALVVLQMRVKCPLIFVIRYIRTIELVGAEIKYVPLLPPADGSKRAHEAAEWKLDIKALANTVTPKTKAIVRCHGFALP